MDNPKQNIVKNIAQDLDCGFDCYYNSKTDEIITIPNFSQFSDEEDFKEAFRDSLEKIEKHQSDFIKFEALESLSPAHNTVDSARVSEDECSMLRNSLNS